MADQFTNEDNNNNRFKSYKASYDKYEKMLHEKSDEIYRMTQEQSEEFLDGSYMEDCVPFHHKDKLVLATNVLIDQLDDFQHILMQVLDDGPSKDVTEDIEDPVNEITHAVKTLNMYDSIEGATNQMQDIDIASTSEKESVTMEEYIADMSTFLGSIIRGSQNSLDSISLSDSDCMSCNLSTCSDKSNDGDLYKRNICPSKMFNSAIVDESFENKANRNKPRKRNSKSESEIGMRLIETDEQTDIMVNYAEKVRGLSLKYDHYCKMSASEDEMISLINSSAEDEINEIKNICKTIKNTNDIINSLNIDSGNTIDKTSKMLFGAIVKTTRNAMLRHEGHLTENEFKTDEEISRDAMISEYDEVNERIANELQMLEDDRDNSFTDYVGNISGEFDMRYSNFSETDEDETYKGYQMYTYPPQVWTGNYNRSQVPDLNKSTFETSFNKDSSGEDYRFDLFL